MNLKLVQFLQIIKFINMIIKNKKWFTLVEIIVAVTIFSIVMISVMSVYIISSETTYNSDIDRAMHESIKNIVMEISEDITKNGISWVSDSISSPDCKLPEKDKNDKKEWFIFCTWSHIYMIYKKDDLWNLFAVSDSNKSECEKIGTECYLTKAEIWDKKPSPLTNNLVTVRKANFIVTNDWVKKVTIVLELQPSTKAWVRSSLVEKNIFNLQTTLSERTYNTLNKQNNEEESSKQ